MPCCGQPATGYKHVWHLRGLPGRTEPLEFDDQATARREQSTTHGGRGTLVRVTKKV